MRTGRRDKLVALLLGVVATLVLLFASGNQGYTRDEGYYFDAAENHAAFYEQALRGLLHGSLDGLRRPAVDRYFSYNHEHPPLMKTLFGLSWRLLHECDCPHQVGRHPGYPQKHRTLGLLSESQALRLPAHAFGGLLVALTFLFGLHAFSRRVGLVASVLALAVPRYFFHAELSCFDAPMATTWLLVVYAYWRSLDPADPRRWGLWTGVAFALALGTKHNAFFLPFVLLAHYLWVHRRTLARLRLPPVPPAFLAMATVGVALYVAMWPWMWFEPLHLVWQRGAGLHVTGRFAEYVTFHLHHVYYNFEFLGRNYNKPPFPRSFPFVMTLLTAPVTTMALGVVGASAVILGPARARRASVPANVVEHPTPTFRRPIAGQSDDVGLLLVLNALFPPAIITLTGAPIFGATKHWLPMLPFLALLAGLGVDVLIRAVGRTLAAAGTPRDRLVSIAAIALACAPAIAETWRSHPYALSHYNLLAGGPAGGADLGMNRQFWGYATRGLLPWLNAHVPPRGGVYWHDTNQPILNMNVREKLLRDDITNTGFEEPGVERSTTAMVIHEKHFNKYEYWIWDFYGTAQPAQVLTFEGVPLVTMYQRPSSARSVEGHRP